MSITTPLTAGPEIARVPPPSINKNAQEPRLSLNLGEFEDDILTLSREAKEKQKIETAIQAESKINEIANDVVRVTSTIGRAKTSGNLTAEQATALYQKIANLL